MGMAFTKCEGMVPNDLDNKVVTRLALRCWANFVAGQQSSTEVMGASALAAAIAAKMKREQDANLISRIYELSGIGAPPLSGGKFELKNRNKRF